jgi:hypothetical protein
MVGQKVAESGSELATLESGGASKELWRRQNDPRMAPVPSGSIRDYVGTETARAAQGSTLSAAFHW